MYNINVLLLAGLLTLSSCSSIKQLDIFSLDFEREPLALEKPTIHQFEKLKWIIIDGNNNANANTKLTLILTLTPNPNSDP